MQGLEKFLDFTGKVGLFAVHRARIPVQRYAQCDIEDILASEVRASRAAIRSIEMRQLHLNPA